MSFPSAIARLGSPADASRLPRKYMMTVSLGFIACARRTSIRPSACRSSCRAVNTQCPRGRRVAAGGGPGGVLGGGDRSRRLGGGWGGGGVAVRGGGRGGAGGRRGPRGVGIVLWGRVRSRNPREKTSEDRPSELQPPV